VLEPITLRALPAGNLAALSVLTCTSKLGPEENAMQSLKTLTLAAALLALPAVTAAQAGNKMSGPGQSEFAPGQRAQAKGTAKDYAPGQRMQSKDVKSQPGASEYAPGHLPNKNVKK
jgi:hypothetical protein